MNKISCIGKCRTLTLIVMCSLFAFSFCMTHSSATARQALASDDKAKGATEIQGMIQVDRSSGGCFIKTDDGKRYRITGKLETMLKGMFRDQTLRVEVKILKEATARVDGLVDVLEIVLEIH